jgi:Zn finger protein HypA/HybF involved in hydrogenase expression
MNERERMQALRQRAESAFTRNQYGLWCPNCEERIDELWPASCDHCGYPNKGFTRFDEDDDDR